MSGCFRIFRLLVSFFIALLLFVAIIIVLPIAWMGHNLTNKDNLKLYLKQSNVYKSASDIIYPFLKEKFGQEDVEDKMPFTDEQLVDLAGQISDEVWLETETNKALDSVYMWLEADTDKIALDIDASNIEESIVQNVTDLFFSKAEDLPECKEVPAGTSFDPFTAECVPPGFETSDMEEQVIAQLENQGLFKDGKLNFEDIQIEAGLQKRIQQIYGFLKKVHIYAVVLILAISALLFLMLPDLKNKFLFVGMSWVVSSALLLIGTLFLRNRFNIYFESSVEQIQTQFGQYQAALDVVGDFLKIIFMDALSACRQHAIVLIVLGFVFVIGGIVLYFTKRRYYIEEDSSSGSGQDGGGKKELPPLPDKAKQMKSQMAPQYAGSGLNKGQNLQQDAAPAGPSPVKE